MEVGFPWKNEGEFRRGEGMSARNKEVEVMLRVCK